MSSPRARVALAVAAGLMVVGSALGLVGVPSAGPSPSAPSASSASAVPILSASAPAATSDSAPARGSSNSAASMAEAALAASRAAGISSQVVYVPRPSASPAAEARAASQGHVTPLYTGDPAPIGLADYGLSAGPGGSVVATTLNTTSLRAEVDANGTGIQPMDLYDSTPDAFGIQLNAVVTNVTLFGVSNYSFWTQNVISYNPATHFMVFVTNVWNFSGGPLSSNTFYKHGPHGEQVGTSYYFAELILPRAVTYPFDAVLFLNSTIADGRDAVDFSVSITGPGESFSFPTYDYVVFNSQRAKDGVAVTVPSNYTANGLEYNPIGLTDDFELDLGGPGGGSQADLFAADAQLALEYRTGGGTYASVPSAFNYGGETGETVTGANVAWSNAPGGPNGVSSYGTMTTGPPVLRGLWNATGAEGSYPLTLGENPSNAFTLVTPTSGSPNFVVGETTYAPNVYTDTFWLTPGSYAITVELSDYAPVLLNVTILGGAQVYNITLNATPSAGVYTPLWAFSNDQVAAISSSGSGTPTLPYYLFNNSVGPLAPVFGLYNDYAFPVFPGVFLKDVSVSTELYRPPSFATTTNTFQSPGPNLSQENDLPMWFWNVSGVALLDGANISGWFSETAYDPLSFNAFNVIFYESSGNLIARNHFTTQSQGLLLYSGGTFFGPADVGGGNNTVWNNTFRQVAPPSSCPSAPNCTALVPPSFDLGLEIAEAPDLIYNNYFATATTAWELPINLYTGVKQTFVGNDWNIAVQRAGAVHYVAGFPTIGLFGSVINTSWQGGNFWWDYGLAANSFNGANNPFGLLPYVENATTPIRQILGGSYYDATYIYPGGDLHPLIPGSLFEVKLVTSGRAKVAPKWKAMVENASNTSIVLDNFTTTLANHTVDLPNGTYRFVALAPYTTPASPGGLLFTVSNASSTLPIRLKLGSDISLLTFRETGLPVGTQWSVAINGTTTTTWGSNASGNSTGTSIAFDVTDGNYNYVVGPIAGEVTPHEAGLLTVFQSRTFSVPFHPRTYAVTFTETGLVEKKLSWKVTVGTLTTGSSHSTLVVDVANGTHSFAVKPVPGWSVVVLNTLLNTTTGGKGNVTVFGAPVNFTVTFTRVLYVLSFEGTGLPTGTKWSVDIHSKTFTSTSSYINVSLPNGTYHFGIPAVTGLKADPGSGTIHVKGAGAVIEIQFSLSVKSVETPQLLPTLDPIETGARSLVLAVRG